MAKHIVMLLTNSFCPDPRVYKEAKYLISKGFRVSILCWHREKDIDLPLHENVEGINVVRYRIPSVLGSGLKQIPSFFKYIFLCRNYLKKNQYDFLHGHDLDGVITGCLARTKKKPLVFDMHEFYEDVGNGREWLRRIKRFVTIFMIKKSIAAIRTNDLYLRNSYKSIFTKLFLLKNLPDKNLVRSLPKTEHNVFRIGYHGAVRSQILEFKTLFEAVKEMPDVRVDVYGTGPDLPKLKKIVKNYNNVFLHGRFDGAHCLSELYANTDVEFAGYRPESNTKDEQEVVKYFECIVTGTPMILTSAYKKMKEEIVKYGFGITCDTRNVDEVKNAIVKMKEDVLFRRQCAQNELNQSYRYDWNEAVKILDSIYG